MIVLEKLCWCYISSWYRVDRRTFKFVFEVLLCGTKVRPVAASKL